MSVYLKKKIDVFIVLWARDACCWKLCETFRHFSICKAMLHQHLVEQAMFIHCSVALFIFYAYFVPMYFKSNEIIRKYDENSTKLIYSPRMRVFFSFEITVWLLLCIKQSENHIRESYDNRWFNLPLPVVYIIQLWRLSVLVNSLRRTPHTITIHNTNFALVSVIA